MVCMDTWKSCSVVFSSYYDSFPTVSTPNSGTACRNLMVVINCYDSQNIAQYFAKSTAWYSIAEAQYSESLYLDNIPFTSRKSWLMQEQIFDHQYNIHEDIYSYLLEFIDLWILLPFLANNYGRPHCYSCWIAINLKTPIKLLNFIICFLKI